MSYFREQCIDTILYHIAMLDLSDKSTIDYLKEETLDTLNSTNRGYRSDLNQSITKETPLTESEITAEYEPCIRLLNALLTFCDKELNQDN